MPTITKTTTEAGNLMPGQLFKMAGVIYETLNVRPAGEDRVEINAMRFNITDHDHDGYLVVLDVHESAEWQLIYITVN